MIIRSRGRPTAQEPGTPVELPVRDAALAVARAHQLDLRIVGAPPGEIVAPTEEAESAAKAITKLVGAMRVPLVIDECMR